MLGEILADIPVGNLSFAKSVRLSSTLCLALSFSSDVFKWSVTTNLGALTYFWVRGVNLTPFCLDNC